jgi:serine/threonine-protein kinase HipA
VILKALNQFRKEDLLAVAASSDLKGAEQVIQEVLDAVEQWPEFAEQTGVDKKRIRHIAEQHRMSF